MFQLMEVALNLAVSCVLVREYIFCKLSPLQIIIETVSVNCAYGPWVWDDCSVTCGDGGFQIGTRPILTEASGGGNPCDQETVMGRACGDPCIPGKQDTYFYTQ